ncbi:MAG TPA: Crp/Fnr family transcriptional regulator [Peptococcaceae bacterium]|nr:Crp/Fnr family transcriptional regulator [Peptococcaceae bacterium]
MHSVINTCFDEVIWNKLVQSGKKKTFEKGEKILIRGKASPGLICLIKGKVKISSEISNGHERIFGLLVAPTMFGETEAFDSGPCMISATALSKAEISVVALTDIKRLIAENPEIAYFIIQSIGIKLRWTTFQAEDMTNQRVGCRLANLLLGHGKYAVFTYRHDTKVLSITHEEIAQFIGSTRPKVTILLREFARKGFIESRRGEIGILNEKALQEYLEFQQLSDRSRS